MNEPTSNFTSSFLLPPSYLAQRPQWTRSILLQRHCMGAKCVVGAHRGRSHWRAQRTQRTRSILLQRHCMGANAPVQSPRVR